MYYVIKVAITAVLVVAIAEISKRSSLAGAILASIPLISVIALTWLYLETKDVSRVSALSMSIFWLVLPSLVLFISLPLLLKIGWSYFPSLLSSITMTALSYWLMISVLSYFKIQL